MQQKIVSQSEALEIAMKLEASPVGENGAGMAQVQSQLAVLTIQLQELVKGKEKHVRRSGASHVEQKVIIRMNVQFSTVFE
jgi:hypothetical protein